MAELLNHTRAPLIFSVLGEQEIPQTYKTVIPGKDGAPPEVVSHVVTEVRVKPIKSIVIPANVPRDNEHGLLELDQADLKQLKKQDEFMAAVKRRDLTITQH